jgi:uncharacterized protein (TIGR03083 family)
VLPVERYHASLEADAEAFAALVRSGDPDRPVRSCPGWTLRDLARHLGGIHRWATQAIRTGAPGQQPSGPEDRGALTDWFVEGATLLLETLRATDPDAPAWTFGPHPRTASFWSRRQAQETAVHLWDARKSQGLPSPLDADLAADGVDEVATVFFPRQVRLGRIPPLGRGVRLLLDDGPSSLLAGDGTDPDAPAAATLAGPADRLLLALWGRAGVDGLRVTGDPGAVQDLLAAGITP